MITADTSEVRRLSTDLDQAASSALGSGAIDAAVRRSAQSLVDAYAQQARSSTDFKDLAGAFSYDRASSPGIVQYEVGPDRSLSGGDLGAVFFFGDAQSGGTGDLDGPLAAEGDAMVGALSQMLDGLL